MNPSFPPLRLSLPLRSRVRRRLTTAVLIAGLPLFGCESDGNAPPKPRAAALQQAGQAAMGQAGQSNQAKAPAIRGEEVVYQAGEVSLKGYLAYDTAQKVKRPGILVVHEWWGHNDYARDRARELARMGYTALAVDMYGDGKRAEHPEDAKKFSGAVMGNLATATQRFAAAQTLLQQHGTTDPEKISAIGYCFGGGVVLQMARLGLDLDGVASFHGMLGTKAAAKKDRVKARVLVMHGEADPFVPAKQVDDFKQEMQAAGVSLRFVSYPGAKHAFTVPGVDAKGEKFKLPLAYDQAAAEDSWKQLKQFLSELYPA